VVAVLAVLVMRQRLSRHEGSDSSRIGQRVTVACAAALALTEVAFLLTAAPGLWSSSPAAFAVTPAEAELQHLVGQSRVGFAVCAGSPCSRVWAYCPTPTRRTGSPSFPSTTPPSAELFHRLGGRLRDCAAACRRGPVRGLLPLGVVRVAGPGVRGLVHPGARGIRCPSETVLVATIGGEGVYRCPERGWSRSCPEG